MKLRILILALGLSPAAASAAGFDYDYIELGHALTSGQNPQLGEPGNGSETFADLSYTLLDGIQFRAGYGAPHYAAPADARADDYSFGITGESSVNDDTDAYTDILYLNNHYSSSRPIVATDYGYRLAVGLRHRAWQSFELDGYVAHNYLTSASNEAGVGVLYSTTHWLAVGVFYAHDSDYNNTTSLRLRLYF